MLVMLFEVIQLPLYFLRAPQGGVAVIETTASGQESWMSTADAVNLLALNLTLFGGLTVLAFSIWPLFRSMIACAEYPCAGNEE